MDFLKRTELLNKRLIKTVKSFQLDSQASIDGIYTKAPMNVRVLLFVWDVREEATQILFPGSRWNEAVHTMYLYSQNPKVFFD